jgi:hypothetical protein
MLATGLTLPAKEIDTLASHLSHTQALVIYYFTETLPHFTESLNLYVMEVVPKGPTAPATCLNHAQWSWRWSLYSCPHWQASHGTGLSFKFAAQAGAWPNLYRLSAATRRPKLLSKSESGLLVWILVLV